MAQHADKSPSASVRWLPCPGSMALPGVDRRSRAAAEGTVMHNMAAMLLRNRDMLPASFIGQVYTQDGFEFTVDDDMLDPVVEYVDACIEAIGDNPYAVEVEVPIGHLTGEEGATGTADLVIFRPDELEVRDAKFGMREVEAENNSQLAMYGLGTLKAYEEFKADWERVRLVIHQPRVAGPKEWVVPMAEFVTDWTEEIEVGARRVDEGRELYKSDGLSDDFKRYYLQPTNKGCEFCPAAQNCPALRAEAMAADEEFEDLTKQSGDTLAEDMARIPRIEKWCKSKRAEMERRVFAGEKFADWKLVQGRMGNKRWIDEDKAAAVLMKKIGPDCWKRSLLSPTQAGKIVKGDAEINALVTASPGKPSVAPATDRRPAISPEAVEFDNLDEDTEE